MSDPQRIAQFRKMASDDPNNELAHFSLGRELLTAGEHLDAVASLKRAIELNSNLSKAYQLMAQALLAIGERETAIATLTHGVKVADARGDLMPRNEMTAKLRELGVAVAETTSAGPAVTVGDGQVLCKRCGKTGPQLASPPFKTPFGQQVFEGTCAPCWGEAIKMGTKVINELRLPLTDPNAQKMWIQHIREFLNL